jgi:NADH-quinone oxidoreductase subunit L
MSFAERPGLWFVTATLLPLASFLLLLIAGGVKNFVRARRQSAVGASFYEMLGGDTPSRIGAYVATAAIGLAFVCSLIGFVAYLDTGHKDHEAAHKLEHDLAELRHEKEHSTDPKREQELDNEIERTEKELAGLERRWADSVFWAKLSKRRDEDGKEKSMLSGVRDPGRAHELRVGYYIDDLSAIMFLMVTLVATLIHLFSIGYMSEETAQVVEDHQVHTEQGHLHRRGRFGRFFMYLSLFCFSMLNLVLADNLFQVFVSWELVGICSFLLIGHYFERQSASNAANKAFITNRIGDAGFIIGLLIVWTYLGSFNFQDIFTRVRSPEQGMSTKKGEHGHPVDLAYAHRIVVGEVYEVERFEQKRKYLKVQGPDEPVHFGTQAVLFPRQPGSHFKGAGPGGLDEFAVYADPRADQYGSMPYWLLVAAGLGVFMGCVGKSAQFPLQVWLPDAMEGPTPVSALIHAATMVAAGVYLVGRCFPLFTAEVLLVIAYTGAVTLFVAATIAVVQTDIKKVLAYSTVSQLGYMMLGLGVGGWVAGLFHLLTHAFFKALLFLGSGSVIYGCHHEQDMSRMGGLYPKMKITALTMLVGVLAIAGIPLFSGWYSKDAILAGALGFGMLHQEHFLLFLLPLLTAGITTFYMFRMWFMTFAGKPRDQHVYDHAHESPWTMTVPLIVLAFFSVVVAWGWPMWDPEASVLEHQLHHAMPESVKADFGVLPGSPETLLPVGAPKEGDPANSVYTERYLAHEYHGLAGYLALAVVAAALVLAALVYYYRVLDPAEAKEQFPGVYGFLAHKWYFDELYSAVLVRPALRVAGWCRGFDLKVIDGIVHFFAWLSVAFSWLHGWFDRYVVDGLANLISTVAHGVGGWLRNVQTGYIRSYVLFLVLAAVGIWIVLSFLFGSAPVAVGSP